MTDHPVDILAFGAHPDDIELGVAGTLIRAIESGKRVALCDLTEGERGTRGTVETRREETRNANRVMGIDDRMRWNLGIPDGGITGSEEHLLRVVRTIRHFRPDIILYSWERDRHPDHGDSHRLVQRAIFDAGLRMVATEHDGEAQAPHTTKRSYCYFHTWERTPDFFVDISAQVGRKLDTLAAYGSQLTVPGRSRSAVWAHEPRTFISGEDFIEAALGRMRHWGLMAGVRYAEGFVSPSGPVLVNDLLDTLPQSAE